MEQTILNITWFFYELGFFYDFVTMIYDSILFHRLLSSLSVNLPCL